MFLFKKVAVNFLTPKSALCCCLCRVYDIGIDVRFGQGRYRDTRIVTLATRYQLENRTQHALAFSQRHFVRGQVSTSPAADVRLGYQH